METKGKAVDSVIQYQLHKKTEGGGSGDFECKFNGVKRINITYSEDILVTSEYYDSLTDFEKAMIDGIHVTVGGTIKWVYSDIKPIDFINYPFIDCYLYGRDSLDTINAFDPRKVIILTESDGVYDIEFNTDVNVVIDIENLTSNNINSNFINVLPSGQS